MAKYKCMVEVEIDIDDYYINEGYNVGDMIQNEVGEAFNGSGMDWIDISDITPVNN